MMKKAKLITWLCGQDSFLPVRKGSGNSVLFFVGLFFFICIGIQNTFANVSTGNQSVLQRTNTITGTVADAGEPLIGASVTVKGTSNGTVTDFDGHFNLDCKLGQTIVISYIGYLSQEIKVSSYSPLNITLKEDVSGLEDVVVIGYGTARKTDLTGATARADLKVMEKSANVNLLQSLKGVIPGLNVGATTSAGGSPSFSIRGQNSISGSQSPLVVLDGIIYRGDLVDINPADIQSIDVLKDASSCAIYGSQAANGVILITTKCGGNDGKPVIEYNGSISLTTPIKKIKVPNREQFLQQFADIFIDKSRIGDDLTTPNPDWDPTPYLKSAQAAEGYVDGTDTDWYDLLTVKTPYLQNHNVSVRGKNNNSHYFVSFGFTDQKNKVKNDTFKRYNIRINLSTNITNWLEMGTDASFTSSDYSGVSPSFTSCVHTLPLLKAYDESGDIVKYPDGGGVTPLMSVDNPDVNMRYKLTGVFYANVDIPFIKGLSYRINYARNYTWTKRYNFDPVSNSETGKGYKTNSLLEEYTVDNILTYKRDFGKHSVNATFVYGVENRQYENTRAEGNRFSDQTFSYNNLSLGQSDLAVVGSSAWKETSLYSMARVVYSYYNKYIFTGTIRRDGFSGFGENHKFGTFPSVAMAWRISEENFMKSINWLDNLKLRISYGLNGNRTLGRYSTQSSVTKASGYVFGDGGSPELYSKLKKLPNPDLKWETTASWNFGFDFSLLNGHLFGNYEFYIANTRDLLYNISIPSINGMTDSYVPTNIGKLQNIGHEITVTGIPVKTKSFQWTVTGNFSTNKNKVKTILGYDVDGDGKEDDLVSSGIFIGKSLNAIYSYNCIGIWQLEDYRNGMIPAGFTYGTYKIEDLNDDGKITAEEDRKIIGYEDPLYRFSIQNRFSYKDFDLNIFVNSVQGGKNHYMSQTINEAIPDHLQGSARIKYDWWTPENPNAKYRQLGAYNTTIGNSYCPYTSRSFIRLQELSLAYNIPTSLLKKIHVNRAKIYISGTNLFTITDWDGIDPEANQGIEVTSGYPTMKSFVFGVNFEL